jgi:MtaA/CmuA family methyltransferase
MTGRERVMSLISDRPVDHLPLMPITMMFAARFIGEKYGSYSHDYKLQAEAQMRTAEAFGFDQVSVICDSAEAADCGARFVFFDDQPSAIDGQNARLADKSDLAALKMPIPTEAPEMLNRLRAVTLMHSRVGNERLVEGWLEGPLAAAADLRGINTLMLDFYDDPDFVIDLFEFVLEVGIRFGKSQIEAGAELIGVGDSAASLVGPAIYREFVWPFEKRLVDALHAAGGKVRLHICGNTHRILEDIGRLDCDIVDIDSAVPLPLAREKIGPKAVLLGNIDPVRDLYSGSPETIAASLSECHRQAGSRYIVAAGCEVPRDTPAENIDAMRHYAAAH